ncbi:hypothetical protein [uncultured Flavonifractor sp.]|uniref:hypothetical protein n=1 Tax=uncultured Flavonifractor sp. TaxID=1193534 RepID=UPI0025946C07|nr:hypothetical protein [uncultured Flavonifractor sp.]
MGRTVIPFSEVRTRLEQRHSRAGAEAQPSERYYEALGGVMESLKQLAREQSVSLKEAMIDLTYLAVGDEIVTKLIDGEGHGQTPSSSTGTKPRS